MTESQIAQIMRGLGRLDKRMGSMDGRLDHFDERFNTIDERMGLFDERLTAHCEGVGSKKTAVTGGGAGAIVTAVVLAIFEGLKRLHVGV